MEKKNHSLGAGGGGTAAYRVWFLLHYDNPQST